MQLSRAFARRSASETEDIRATYAALLAGSQTGTRLWQNLRATSQLGVTTGTLQSKDPRHAHPHGKT